MKKETVGIYGLKTLMQHGVDFDRLLYSPKQGKFYFSGKIPDGLPETLKKIGFEYPYVIELEEKNILDRSARETGDKKNWLGIQRGDLYIMEDANGQRVFAIKEGTLPMLHHRLLIQSAPVLLDYLKWAVMNMRPLTYPEQKEKRTAIESLISELEDAGNIGFVEVNQGPNQKHIEYLRAFIEEWEQATDAEQPALTERLNAYYTANGLPIMAAEDALQLLL